MTQHLAVVENHMKFHGGNKRLIFLETVIGVLSSSYDTDFGDYVVRHQLDTGGF